MKLYKKYPQEYQEKVLKKQNKKLNKHRKYNKITQTQHLIHKQQKETLVHNKQINTTIILQYQVLLKLFSKIVH